MGILGLASSGLYLFYWLYVTWKHGSDETRDDRHPLWHSLAILVPIYNFVIVHQHFTEIRRRQREAEVASNLSPGLAVLIFVAVAVVGLIDQLAFGDDISPLTFLTLLMLAGLIVWGQANLNRYWDARHDVEARAAKWGIGEILIGVASAMFVGVFLVYMLLPTTPSVFTVFEANQIVEIDVDSEVTGSIDGVFEVDGYVFEAVAGQGYRIEVYMALPGDPLEDALLALWDTDGSTVLEQNADNHDEIISRITWSAPESGTYYLTVESGPDGFAKGGYRVAVRRDSPR